MPQSNLIVLRNWISEKGSRIIKFDNGLFVVVSKEMLETFDVYPKITKGMQLKVTFELLTEETKFQPIQNLIIESRTLGHFDLMEHEAIKLLEAVPSQ